MKLHVHHRPADTAAPITAAEWDGAAGRFDQPVEATFGTDAASFRRIAADVEVLVASPLGLLDLLPLESPRLRLVFVTWAGLDRLAPYDWLPAGVRLLNNSGPHGLKAAEYVVMAMLMMKNSMPSLARAQAAGQWVPAVGRTLAGCHVVVLGLGAIGGATAALARKVGMRVTGVRASPRPHPDCDAVVGPDALDDTLPSADFVALALPYAPSSKRLLNRDLLRRLPSHAGIVNVGRGRTLDETALYDMLDAGKLGGAVLDVFEHEPLPPGHRAWTTPNLVVTPHMSADDPDTVNAATLDVLAANLNAWWRHEPLPNEFDIERGSRLHA